MHFTQNVAYLVRNILIYMCRFTKLDRYNEYFVCYYRGDTQGVSTDDIVPLVLSAADNSSSGVKIAFHMEPYEGRNVESIRSDLEYLSSNYFKKYNSISKSSDGRPYVYIYDSYHTNSSEWFRLLSKTGDLTVRKTELDGFFIGLLLDQHSDVDIEKVPHSR